MFILGLALSVVSSHDDLPPGHSEDEHDEDPEEHSDEQDPDKDDTQDEDKESDDKSEDEEDEGEEDEGEDESQGDEDDEHDNSHIEHDAFLGRSTHTQKKINPRFFMKIQFTFFLSLVAKFKIGQKI